MEQLLIQLLDWATNIKNQTQIEGNTSTIVGGGLEKLIGAITDLQKNKHNTKDFDTALAEINRQLQNILRDLQTTQTGLQTTKNETQTNTQRLSQLVAELQNATIRFKGYHTDATTLPQDDRKKGDFAWVGSPYPGTVYKVNTDGGAWIKTDEVPQQEEVNLEEYAKKEELTSKADILTLSKSDLTVYKSKTEARNSVPQKNRSKYQNLQYTLKIGDALSEARSFEIIEQGKMILSDGTLRTHEKYNVFSIDVTGGDIVNILCGSSSAPPNGDQRGGAYFDVDGNYISGYYYPDGAVWGQKYDMPIPVGAVELRHCYYNNANAQAINVSVFTDPIVKTKTDNVYELIMEQYVGDNPANDWSEDTQWITIQSSKNEDDILHWGDEDITGNLIYGQRVLDDTGAMHPDERYQRSGFIKVSEGDVLSITTCLKIELANTIDSSCIGGYASFNEESYILPLLNPQKAGMFANPETHHAIDDFEVVVPRGVNYVVGCSNYVYPEADRRRILRIVRKNGKRNPSNVIDRNAHVTPSVMALCKSFGATDESSQNIIPFFSHISDIHGDIAVARSFLEYSAHVGVDLAFATGDVVVDHWGNDFSYFARLVKESGVTTLNTIGNHEVYNYGMDSCTDVQCHDRYMRHLESNPNIILSGKGYYYTDLPQKKVRVIAINEFQQGGAQRDRRYFDMLQLNWFADTLKSTPNGYAILVLTHQPQRDWEALPGYTKFWQKIRNSGSIRTNITGEPIPDIVDAFIGRTTIDRTYNQNGVIRELHVEADFSEVDENIDFVAYLNGHFHADNIGVLKNTAHRQVNLNIALGSTRLHETRSDLPRKHFTPTEDLFNMYGIDYKNKTVKIVRVGSNMPFDLDKRDFMIIPYK